MLGTLPFSRQQFSGRQVPIIRAKVGNLISNNGRVGRPRISRDGIKIVARSANGARTGSRQLRIRLALIPPARSS